MKDVVNFFRGVRTEFSKVVWAKWEEFVGSTIVVLFLMAIFAVFLAVIDKGWVQLMRQIFQFFGL